MANYTKREISLSPINIGKILDGGLKNNSKSIQLTQTVVYHDYYPSEKVGDSLQDNPIPLSEFGIADTCYTSTSKRNANLQIPNNWTEEDVQKLLASKPKTQIIRILSLNPILSDGQKSAINSGLTTLDKIKLNQLCKKPESEEILMYNGLPFYRRCIIDFEGTKQDSDLRPSEYHEVKKEVNVTMVSQDWDV